MQVRANCRSGERSSVGSDAPFRGGFPDSAPPPLETQPGPSSESVARALKHSQALFRPAAKAANVRTAAILSVPVSLKHTIELRRDIEDACREAWALARQVEGGLTEREVRFLALAMACTPADGVTVEIGSFKGRSTVALASIARRYDMGPIIAVDPHSGPSITDPPVGPTGSSYDAFITNLRRTDLQEHVEVHRAYSRDLASGWDRPIRLLWIDGDHTYDGALEDWRLFGPHLAPGGVVAMHDVLHGYEGPIRVFVEEVLRRDDVGPAGAVGSIGWAQQRPPGTLGRRQEAARLSLARRAGRLIPYTRTSTPLRGASKLLYKLRRWQVPHGTVSAHQWVDLVALER